ncbi:MAG: PAS domain-containing protein [Calditrichaeota bacterium]|nr:PAS domain-containing protein [Calditrichota bacterium]
MKAQHSLFDLKKSMSNLCFHKNNYLLLLLLIAFTLGFAGKIQAQKFWISTYSEGDGLANSRVYDLAQDSLGQIWFATRGGISVYDGFQWKKYSVAEGLPAMSYSQIEIDERGRVWVMPEYSTLRVSYFDGKSWNTLVPLKISAFSGANSFKVTTHDNKTSVAIGSRSQGLAIYAENRWHLISKKEGLPSAHINGLESWRGNFLIATNNGLSLIRNLKADREFAAQLQLPAQNILGIFIENKKEEDLQKLKIWLIGRNWVGFAKNGKFTLVSRQIRAIINNSGYNLCFLYDGFRGIYYGNNKFLRFLDIKKQTNQFIGERNGLISEGAINLVCDLEGNIWVAGMRGASKIASIRFANFAKEQGLLEDEVTAIASMGGDQIVFGHNRGITFFDGKRFKPIAFKMDSLLPETMGRTLDLFADGAANVWAACSHFGIVKARADSGIVLHIPGKIFPSSVNSLVIGADGRIYFSGGNYFCRLSADFSSYKIIRKFENAILRKLILLPDGAIAIATKGKGAIIYRHGRFSPLTRFDPEIDDVFSVMAESDSSFFIGTIHGLFRATSRNHEQIKFKGKTINRPIYSILKDGYGRVWLGSDNGIFRWDGFDLRHYTVKNGFVGQETNRSAAFVDRQGHVWFGADRGVSCFREEYDFRLENIPAPRVQILDSRADEIVFDPSKDKSLNYNDNNLEFRFRSISFINERENYFRYKLEGYEKMWSDPFVSRDPLIRFTNLSPGKYRFYLQSRNALGRWSDIVSTGSIVINEPYWMKWWFYLILFLVIAALVVATAVIIYQRQYSRRLEKEVRQRTAEVAESEKQYRTTIDSLKDAVHVVDRDLQIQLCNKRVVEWAKKLALDPDIAGMNVFEAFPFLPEKVREEYEMVFQTGKMLETEENNLVYGQRIATETRKIPIFENEKVVSVLTVIHDVTDKKYAEAEKFRAQALLTAAIEQTPAGIVIADAPDIKLRIANSAALRILNIKDEQSVDLAQVFDPEKWKLFTQQGKEIKRDEFPLFQAVKRGKKIENQIVVSRRENGKQRWMYVNAAPVLAEKGKIIAGVMVFQDITELKEAEDKIKETLREKDVLLKEIHHRVKNNLQVVSSLLFLQSKQVVGEDAKAMFQDSRDRIKSIALVHEKMYRSDSFAQVNFADYVRSLSHSLYQVHHVDPGKVDFLLDLDDVSLSMEKAIPCGLIVNELISNSLKYAFPQSMKKERKIEIKIKAKEEDSVELIVRDNGAGLPKNLDIHKAESLGLKLVATLAENQLDGELKIDRRRGTKFIIRFKNSE